VATDDEMAAINEAYRVLSDPGRRALYDRQTSGRAGASGTGSAAGTAGSRRAATTTASATTAAAGPVASPWNDGPARVPWRFLGFMAAVGIGVVLVGAALVEPPGPEVPDGLLGPGSCVILQQNNTVREVACTESSELVVRQLVPFDQRCPAGTAGFPDGQGMGVACVVTADAVPGSAAP
jgi:molecular chaperone DnaJ